MRWPQVVPILGIDLLGASAALDRLGIPISAIAYLGE
jgi:hypothetical protein